MSGIYWLASYPKSGNTWLRVFLSNYDRNEPEPTPINRLSSANIAYRRQLFDEWLGLETADLPDEVVDQYRPRLYERVAGAEKFRFVRTHERFRTNGNGEPVFSSSATSGVVLLVRRPEDVAASMAHFWQIPVDRAIERMSDDSMTLPSDADSFHDHLPQLVGTWSGHAHSWLESGLRLHVVRYEDLVADPKTHFGKIIGFMGWELDEERLDRAVEFSRIDELRTQEAREGFCEHHTDAPAFFRGRDSNGQRESLNPKQIESLEFTHGPVMRQLGYL